jgi:hypothetical protein
MFAALATAAEAVAEGHRRRLQLLLLLEEARQRLED